MPSAMVVDLFYLRFLRWMSLFVLFVSIFCSFCCLSSVANFSNTEARPPTSAGRSPFFTRTKSDAVYTCALSVGQGYLSMAAFILTQRSQLYRWAAVIPRSNWQSWPLSREFHTPKTRVGIALGRQRVYPLAFTSTMLLPMAFVKKISFFSVKF